MKELKRWRLFDIQSILRNEILDLYNLISGKWGFIKAYSLSPEQILSACSEESNSSFSEFSTKLF